MTPVFFFMLSFSLLSMLYLYLLYVFYGSSILCRSGFSSAHFGILSWLDSRGEMDFDRLRMPRSLCFEVLQLHRLITG